MSKAFVYVMRTVTSEYEQEETCNVPCQYRDRMYFGPCKIPMRPRMEPDDLIVGISPSRTTPRKVLFVAEIDERITFAEAYERFPRLRGPPGPIHVKPASRPGAFPESDYDFISGSVHGDNWRQDLALRELDRFFVCRPNVGWRNRWLGGAGPSVDQELVDLLNQHPVYGNAGLLWVKNQGTVETPIAHGKLYSGLHVEVAPASVVVAWCEERMGTAELPELADTPRLAKGGTGGCACVKSEQEVVTGAGC